jgi:phosphoglycerol transferase MdoB-like AlkP superfamily enzyme
LIEFGLCLLAALVATLWLESFVQPRSVNRAVLHRVRLLHAMPTLVYCLTIFMICYRPVFSGVATMITFAAIVVLNNAKYRALREPLVFSDFALLRKAIQHPALYAKYIGVGKIAAILTIALVAIAAAIFAEHPVIRRDDVSDFFPTVAYLTILLGTLYAIVRGPFRPIFRQFLHRYGPSADVRQDVDKLSLAVCLIFYFFLAQEPDPEAKPMSNNSREAQRRKTASATASATSDRAKSGPISTAAGALPSVVAVQLESFFDARRVHPSVPASCLRNWDRIAKDSVYRGRLEVPAWGANTMRTEFAFLSGLPNSALGVHRFNPFLDLCKHPIWTYAHLYHATGYRTICIHPFAGSFFNRDQVYPGLGFDQFLDISEFRSEDKFGPYVSDRAVADKIIELLKGYEGPQFIFAITMENHGKWENNRLSGLVAEDELRNPPLGSREFGIYLRHLSNSAAMVGQLADTLGDLPGEHVLCAFGDHLPSMPSEFERAGFEDPRSDYLVWRKGARMPKDVDVGAETLGRLMLDAVLGDTDSLGASVERKALAERLRGR